MRVAVGSRNPVKVAAVERALEPFDPVVAPVAVDSGVSEQPSSVAETVEGSRNRARRAVDASAEAAERGSGTGDRSDRAERCSGNGGRSDRAPDFGIGLEGGVARFAGSDGRFLIMWAGATDGDRLEVGSGPSLRLPDTVATRIDAGEELGPVMDDRLGSDGIAENEGAAGVLTGGLTDRESALATAVACAVGPLVVDQYD